MNLGEFAMLYRHLALVTIGLGCAVSVPFLFGQVQPPVRVALLIGVNQYDKRGFADHPLQFAERDVDELAKELTKAGFTVRVMKSSSTGRDRATRAKIETALDEMLKDRKATDIVFIGMSGHGLQMTVRDKDNKEKDDAFFCPCDAVKDDPQTLVSLTDLLGKLDRKGGTNLVMVDACRDDPGRGIRSISGNELNGKLPANTAILFSCSANQQAFETRDAGGGHGVFFYHVLKGIRGDAPRNAKGELSWAKLVEYLQENVNDAATELFPARAKNAPNGDLQTPHELRNLVRVPVLIPAGSQEKNRPALLSGNPTKAQIDASRQPWANYYGVPLESTEDLGNGVKLEMVFIPPGTFQMGSPKNEEGREDDEKQHEVTISDGLYIGKYEVTQEQYEALMGTNPSWFQAGKNGGDKVKGMVTKQFPVESVSWNDTQKLIEKLKEKSGNKRMYRLPTESEWEYICRGGPASESLPFHFQNGPQKTLSSTEANVDHKLGRTAKVGTYMPNRFGVYDMHGNVYEWCEDWYAKDFPANSVLKDPKGPEEGAFRVIRGGSWRNVARFCRSAYRDWIAPSNTHFIIGFRLARSSK